MKWGDITRAFLIVLAHSTWCFISFNRLGSNLGINQSTCISLGSTNQHAFPWDQPINMQPISAWNVTTIVHFRLGGKKGQFLITRLLTSTFRCIPVWKANFLVTLWISDCGLWSWLRSILQAAYYLASFSLSFPFSMSPPDFLDVFFWKQEHSLAALSHENKEL